MKTVKTRKQGDSLIISLPEHLNLKADEEYIIIKKEDKSITLIPKIEELFTEDGEDFSMYYEEEFSDVDWSKDHK